MILAPAPGPEDQNKRQQADASEMRQEYDGVFN